MGTVSVPSSTPFSFQGLQMGIFVFWTKRDWSRKSCYGNTIEDVILFLLWYTFIVPSFKNIALIFPEISFIQYFTIFRCKQNDVITDLICIIEKRRYLLNEKRYFKKKNANLLYFERPLKWAENIFHVICTLMYFLKSFWTIILCLNPWNLHAQLRVPVE